jgi:D-glycero-D-manno-heptose 1,7-bisphosphate phosphatase
MKLIVLDRDGVINQDSDDFIKSPEEWLPIPGSLEAIARLTHAGYSIVVTTNQSGVARGLLDIETLTRIHQKMHQLVQGAGGTIEAVVFCPEVDISHPDRKPNPGMLLQVAKRLKIDLRGVPVLGDSLRDIQAARSVQARPVLVLTGRGQETLAKGTGTEQVPVFRDLAAFADALLAK